MNTVTEKLHEDTACCKCGMGFQKDPWFHRERYRHDPEYYTNDGVRVRFHTQTGRIFRVRED